MSKVYDGKLHTTTLSAMRIATAALFGLDHKYPQRSTINESLKILSDKMPAPTDRPLCRYMVIGDRGHIGTTDEDGDVDVEPVAHSPIHSGLFRARPMVLRELDKDLSDIRRKNYGLRRRETHNNRDYWAYYAKRIDIRGVETTDEEIVKKGDIVSVDKFNYTDRENRPVRGQYPIYNYDDENATEMPDGRYVQAGCDITIAWDEFDVEEYLRAITIIKGKPDKSVISEIALCSGVDFATTGESVTGSPFNYDDVIGLQACYFISLYNNLAQNNDSARLLIRCGQESPFFVGD